MASTQYDLPPGIDTDAVERMHAQGFGDTGAPADTEGEE